MNSPLLALVSGKTRQFGLRSCFNRIGQARHPGVEGGVGKNQGAHRSGERVGLRRSYRTRGVELLGLRPDACQAR